MKTLLLTSHSKESTYLAKLSKSNHWEYSSARGYDYLVKREEWSELLKRPYQAIEDLLPFYDNILLVGSDVLFTNFDKGVEDIVKDGDNIIAPSELPNSRTKLNMGVVIFCNTRATFDLINLIHEKHDEWINMPLIIQGWLDKNHELPVVKDTIRLVDGKVMNSTYKTRGNQNWKPGDWLVHFYGRKHTEKPTVMKEFIRHYLK
jgi:hypothetical protein